MERVNQTKEFELNSFWQRFVERYARDSAALLFRSFKLRQEVVTEAFFVEADYSVDGRCCCLIEVGGAQVGMLAGQVEFCNQIVALSYGGEPFSKQDQVRSLSLHDRVLVKGFFKKLIVAFNELSSDLQNQTKLELLDRDIYMMESLHMPRRPVALRFYLLDSSFEFIFDKRFFRELSLVK